MVRSSFLASYTLLFIATLSVCRDSFAQQKSAYELLPENTQAVIWIRSGAELLDRWERTQLSQLASDELVAPFFEEKRQEIEKRFMDAGWRLNVKPEDLSEYVIGQIAIAWTDKEGTPLKPFALALIADVEDDSETNDRMMKEIEQQLDPIKTEKQTFTHAGVSITKYSLPPRAGELIKQDSYFAVREGLLLVSDDDALIKQMIDRVQNETDAKSLSAETVFRKGRDLAQISGDGQVEYFVRPLGFARVIRAIAGKRSKSNSDMLAVLENQGFLSIRCVCGELIFGQPALDIQHRGYVYADHPLPKSAGILDFPNKASQEVPNFVGQGISSLLATNWNAKDAFWRIEGLVDELAGTPGVFDEVIEGIKLDPNGPRIDIARDVLPLFTNDIYSISDNKQGSAEVDSRRNLIALKVNDAKAMARVLKKAMTNEPDAELVKFLGHQIWKVVHRDNEDFNTDDLDDFGDFGSEPAPAGKNQDQPWLSNWAITVHEDYFLFASHVEMIQEAIQQASETKISPLVESPDYLRAVSALSSYFGDEDASAWRILRTDRAFRVQYELFRKGELRNSQSMLASLLDRLLQNDSEMRSKEQKINGGDLPEFSKISKYLQPGGMLVRTTDNGWEFGSFLLSAKFPGQKKENPTNVTNSTHIGTARVSNSESEAKR